MNLSRTLFSAALMLAFCGASATASDAVKPNAVAPNPATGAVAPPASALPAFNLDADVNLALKTFDVPGIAIAIVKDGKVLAARGFGVRKLGDPAPVDGKTLFEVASNSKAFTAAALAMLVDEGKLAWDDPVTKHLPDFQMYDSYVTHEMTVRDLLTHRSGLGLGAGDLLWWPTTSFSAPTRSSTSCATSPATSFRSSYAYDNLLYIVAGKIIAEKAGKTWGEAIHERILAPLGMTGHHHQPGRERWQAATSPTPHSKINDKAAAVKPMPVPNAVGAVGINTNAEDIARWMNVLLNQGTMAADGKEAACSARSRRASCGPRRRRCRIRRTEAGAGRHQAQFRRLRPGLPAARLQGRKMRCTAARCRASIRRWCWCRKRSWASPS
jgi:CubicO group peptidase (beta-lactamase class C family)